MPALRKAITVKALPICRFRRAVTPFRDARPEHWAQTPLLTCHKNCPFNKVQTLNSTQPTKQIPKPRQKLPRTFHFSEEEKIEIKSNLSMSPFPPCEPPYLPDFLSSWAAVPVVGFAPPSMCLSVGMGGSVAAFSLCPSSFPKHRKQLSGQFWKLVNNYTD